MHTSHSDIKVIALLGGGSFYLRTSEDSVAIHASELILATEEHQLLVGAAWAARAAVNAANTTLAEATANYEAHPGDDELASLEAATAAVDVAEQSLAAALQELADHMHPN